MRIVAREFAIWFLNFLLVTATLNSQARAGAGFEVDRLWPNKEIPYAVCDCRTAVPDVCTKVQCLAKPDVVLKAISDWNASGMKVKLVPREKSGRKPYLIYLAQEDDTNLETSKWPRWCFTEAGFTGSNSPHSIVIGDVCVEDKGSGLGMTVLHETGHAVGLYHEQQRTDRDEFLKVKFPGSTANEAISQSGRICGKNQEEKCEFQSGLFFRHYNYGRDVGEHDLKSIMHYRLREDFDDCVKTELKPADYELACMDLTQKGRKRAEELSIPPGQIGSKMFGLSPLDISTVNELYKDVP
ncbi:M12 family metallopeptidase [Neorhizobium sp. DAR64860/K0K1]|uniref:M12 family metallopeptidase n=1 Tax=Neorhizobium sp. DAR64860/K0K1 TaxID=3421955 RepID=UPI003D29EA8F